MSISNDAGRFFQTDDSIASIERKTAKSKNTHGDPIKLQSKILAAHLDVAKKNAVFVAEAAGDVRRVQTESSTNERIFSLGTAPLTCVAICHDTQTLFTGSWDKTIYAISLDRKAAVRRLKAHTDFVKCLCVSALDGKPILVSGGGGTDASIIVWDISDDNFGTTLHKLKGHVKAIQDVTVDPYVDTTDESLSPQDSIVVFSASSDPEIRRWRISRASAAELPESLENPIAAHETSVYKLRWDADGDLWTASADNTAAHLVRARDWEADAVLKHPDFVRDVLPMDSRSVVVTACRDEDVRLWSITSGELLCTYSGHYEEVTGLVALNGSEFVSVSIDGTLRRWSVEESAMLKYQDELKREADGEDSSKPAEASMLTADEEAELAELMDSD